MLSLRTQRWQAQLSGVILALEAENKEMRARIASLQASGEERDSLLKRIRELR